MKINLKAPILDYENKPVQNKGAEEPLNFLNVFINALNSQLPSEVLTAEVKNRIYQVSMKIYKSDEPNFTPEQLTLIKERVGKIYNPLVYGRVCDLIDGTGEPGEAQSAQATEEKASN